MFLVIIFLVNCLLSLKDVAAMDCQCTCTSPEHPNEKFTATIRKDIFTFNAMKIDKEIAPRRSERINTKPDIKSRSEAIQKNKAKQPIRNKEKNRLNNVWDTLGIKHKQKTNTKKLDNSVTNKQDNYNVWQGFKRPTKNSKASNTNVWGLIKGVGKRHNNANNSPQVMNQLDHTIISNEFNSITQPTGNTNHRNSNNWMQQNYRNNHQDHIVQNFRDHRNNNHLNTMNSNHGRNMRHGSNINHETNVNYGTNTMHGTNMNHGTNVNYGTNTRHGTNINHGTNIGHGTNIDHGKNTGHGANINHETHIGHGTNIGHETNIGHDSNKYHGTNINHGNNNYHGTNNNHDGNHINHGNSLTSQNNNDYGHNNEHRVQENDINTARYDHHQKQQSRNRTTKSNWSDQTHNHYPRVHQTNQGHANSHNFYDHKNHQWRTEQGINKELVLRNSLGKPEKSSKTHPMRGPKPQSVTNFPAWIPWQPVQTNNKNRHSQTAHVNGYDPGHTQWTTTMDPLNINNTDIEPIERELVH